MDGDDEQHGGGGGGGGASTPRREDDELDGYETEEYDEAAAATARERGPSFTNLSSTEVHETRERLRLTGYDTIKTSLARLRAATSGLKHKDRQRKASTLTRRDANLTAILGEQLEQAYEAIAAKDEDLKLAAQIGTALMEKYEDATAFVEDLEERLQVEHEKRKRAKEERTQFKQDARRLHLFCEDLQATNGRLEEKVGRLERALAEAKDRAERPSDEAIELVALEARLERAQRELKEREDEVAEVTAMNDRLLEAEREWNRAAARREKESEQAAAAPAPADGGREGDDELRRQLQEARQGQASSHKEAEDLRAELEDGRLRVQRDAATLLHLREENARLRAEAKRAAAAAAAAAGRAGAEAAGGGSRGSSRAGSAGSSGSDGLGGGGPSDVPFVARAMAFGNVVNALGLVSLAVVAMIAGRHTVFTDAAALLVFSLAWLAFEVRPASREAAAQAAAGFMYHWTGRTVFLLALALVAFSMGVPGYAVGGVTSANLLFNAFVLMEVPDLARRLRRRAAAAARLAGGAPMMAEPLLSSVVQDWPGAGAQLDDDESAGGPRPSAAASSDWESTRTSRGTSHWGPGPAPTWEPQTDASTGRQYFYNAATGQTRFTPPAQ